MKTGFGIGLVAGLLAVQAGVAQENQHGRKWKPLPPTSHVVIEVHKAFNDKPLPNASVIFRATLNGQNDGNLELKTDPDGKATIDVIEIGSHVNLQVIAYGFATYAEDFDVTTPDKQVMVKLVRPKAQISVYENTDGQASQRKAGVQEPPHPVKAPVVPAQPAVPGILQPAATPAAVPAASAPATSPQAAPKQ